ncbi:MOSC domain-containing protein [Pseudomonas parakoreensis]
MTPLQQLIADVPQTGRVRWIGVRPESRGPMIELDAVEARLEAGLTGDHARAGVRNARQVTLIQFEHLAVISALMGRSEDHPVKPEDLRRNLVISGINLFSLKGRRFRIGQAISRPLAGVSPARACKTTSAPAPFKRCAGMAELPPGCYKAGSSASTTVFRSNRFRPEAMLRSTRDKNRCSVSTFSNVYLTRPL